MELKELYKAAKEQLSETINTEDPDFRLEQAEYNKNEKVWDIVVSFLVQGTNKSSPLVALGMSFERIYKRVKINENKEVTGFYIYQQ
jgi:hypothetical protein